MRPQNRPFNALRSVQFHRGYTRYAEGSVLVEFGQTKVLCNATISDTLPAFLKGSDQGWVTAEYSMLPRATATRTSREASSGKQSGRTVEIQRLIARALRQAVDLKALCGYSIMVDCDVIQADGGTRTAAITGGCVALFDALTHLQRKNKSLPPLFKQWIASVSVGVVRGYACLDLEYEEDSQADTDMNVIMTESGKFIEIQGTAEKEAFSHEELMTLLALAEKGTQELITLQKGSIR